MNGKQSRKLRALARSKADSEPGFRKMYKIMKRWFARKELRV